MIPVLVFGQGDCERIQYSQAAKEKVAKAVSERYTLTKSLVDEAIEQYSGNCYIDNCDSLRWYPLTEDMVYANYLMKYNSLNFAGAIQEGDTLTLFKPNGQYEPYTLILDEEALNGMTCVIQKEETGKSCGKGKGNGSCGTSGGDEKKSGQTGLTEKQMKELGIQLKPIMEEILNKYVETLRPRVTTINNDTVINNYFTEQNDTTVNNFFTPKVNIERAEPTGCPPSTVIGIRVDFFRTFGGNEFDDISLSPFQKRLSVEALRQHCNGLYYGGRITNVFKNNYTLVIETPVSPCDGGDCDQLLTPEQIEAASGADKSHLEATLFVGYRKKFSNGFQLWNKKPKQNALPKQPDLQEVQDSLVQDTIETDSLLTDSLKILQNSDGTVTDTRTPEEIMDEEGEKLAKSINNQLDELNTKEPYWKFMPYYKVELSINDFLSQKGNYYSDYTGRVLGALGVEFGRGRFSLEANGGITWQRSGILGFSFFANGLTRD